VPPQWAAASAPSSTYRCSPSRPRAWEDRQAVAWPTAAPNSSGHQAPPGLHPLRIGRRGRRSAAWNSMAISNGAYPRGGLRSRPRADPRLGTLSHRRLHGALARSIPTARLRERFAVSALRICVGGRNDADRVAQKLGSIARVPHITPWRTACPRFAARSLRRRRHSSMPSGAASGLASARRVRRFQRRQHRDEARLASRPVGMAAAIPPCRTLDDQSRTKQDGAIVLHQGAWISAKAQHGNRADLRAGARRTISAVQLAQATPTTRPMRQDFRLAADLRHRNAARRPVRRCAPDPSPCNAAEDAVITISGGDRVAERAGAHVSIARMDATARLCAHAVESWNPPTRPLDATPGRTLCHSLCRASGYRRGPIPPRKSAAAVPSPPGCRQGGNPLLVEGRCRAASRRPRHGVDGGVHSGRTGKNLHAIHSRPSATSAGRDISSRSRCARAIWRPGTWRELLSDRARDHQRHPQRNGVVLPAGPATPARWRRAEGVGS